KEREIQVFKRSVEDQKEILDAGTQGIFVAQDTYSEFSPSQSVTILVSKEKETPYEDDLPSPGFGLVEGSFDINSLFEGFNPQEQLQLVDQYVLDGSITEDQARDIRFMLENYEEPDLSLTQVDAQPLTMGFVPGTYAVDISLFDNSVTDESGNIIPAVSVQGFKDSVCAGLPLGGICIGKKNPVDYPEISMNTWVSGGGVVNITITPDDLYGSDDPFTFFALEMPSPTNWNCDYLYNSFPDAKDDLCHYNLGYCGDYTPENPATYCVPFDIVKPIEEYQDGKEFMVVKDLLTE
ncbi:MAG: hypothetical protein KC535_05590, partial [Nanoarchaeota archaeon]|nr:hypothetical protein [Nanoarchaeota archaeon]